MNEHIVYFNKWCSKCKYNNVLEDEDPCDECLAYPVNEDSHKPVNFKSSEDDE